MPGPFFPTLLFGFLPCSGRLGGYSARRPVWITGIEDFQAGTRRRASGCLAPVGIAAGGSVRGREQSIW
jgi:hypothetical protein